MSAILQGVPERQGLTAVSYLDGVAAPDHFSNGLGYEVDKRLSVDVDGAIAHYHQGLGFTAAGRLAVTLTGPATRFNSGAAPMNATGHLVFALGSNAHYVHGLGYTPNSSVNATGDAPALISGAMTSALISGGPNAGFGKVAIAGSIDPLYVGGLECIYCGSFGPNWMRIDLGPAGVSLLAPTVEVTVEGLGTATLNDLVSGAGYSYGGVLANAQAFFNANIGVPVAVTIAGYGWTESP